MRMALAVLLMSLTTHARAWVTVEPADPQVKPAAPAANVEVVADAQQNDDSSFEDQMLASYENDPQQDRSDPGRPETITGPKVPVPPQGQGFDGGHDSLWWRRYYEWRRHHYWEERRRWEAFRREERARHMTEARRREEMIQRSRYEHARNLSAQRAAHPYRPPVQAQVHRANPGTHGAVRPPVRHTKSS